MRKGLSNVINALVRILFLKSRLHGAPTVASFFNAAILSRVWEWSRDGKELSLLGFSSVQVLGLPRFGSVRVVVKYLTTGFGFRLGPVTTRVQFGSGSTTTRVRFGSKMSFFLHCKIAYTTEENVCFALLNRIMY